MGKELNPAGNERLVECNEWSRVSRLEPYDWPECEASNADEVRGDGQMLVCKSFQALEYGVGVLIWRKRAGSRGACDSDFRGKASQALIVAPADVENPVADRCRQL